MTKVVDDNAIPGGYVIHEANDQSTTHLYCRESDVGLYAAALSFAEDRNNHASRWFASHVSAWGQLPTCAYCSARPTQRKNQF
jgi:hypothetical protein